MALKMIVLYESLGTPGQINTLLLFLNFQINVKILKYIKFKTDVFIFLVCVGFLFPLKIIYTYCNLTRGAQTFA